MARVLSIATVLGLLLASALAFAITERAKTAPSPIASTKVTRKTFSPRAAQAKYQYVEISFRLRTAERLSVWIEDDHGNNVRTLLSSRSEKKGMHVDVQWDGSGDDGLIQPDGRYRPVVKLEKSHRTIVLPNPFTVDTVPPAIKVPKPLHPVLSPDGDGHGDLFRVAYRVSEPAHAMLFVRVGHRTTRVVYTLARKPTGVLEWNGKVQGKALPPGSYLLSVGAQDTAGNRSKPFPFGVANIRYVSLGRKRIVARPGARFAIRVSADAPTVRWKLDGRSGTAAPGTLHFRVPKAKGVYFLYVFVGDHAARAAVVVA